MELRVYISGSTSNAELESVTAKFEEAKELLTELGFEVDYPLLSDADNLLLRVAKMQACQYMFFLNDWHSDRMSRIEHNIANELKLITLYEVSIRQTHPLVETVQGAVQEATGLVLSDYACKSRSRQLVYARMLFAHFCHINKMALTQIALYLQKDHATISWCLKKYDDEVKYNSQFRIMAHKVRDIIEVEKNLNKDVL